MNVAMMQPTFLPWQGFFELIYQSDIFIFLDDFQFSVQSYHQRNRLFSGPGKVDWYTVPVVKARSFGLPLNAACIDESSHWRKKMLNRLRHNYGKAAFFNEVFPRVEGWLTNPAMSLAEHNMGFIRLVLELFGWKKDIKFSSTCHSDLQRSGRVLELLRLCGATKYYAANGSFGYMHEEGIFPVTDIEVLFQNFVPKRYPQVGSPDEFVPFLSVLDSLFNIGPENSAQLIIKGTDEWRSWDQMCLINREAA